MKKLLFILISILTFSSCITLGYKETSIIDYSGYYNEGFFLTESNSVNFEYIPIGSVVSIAAGNKVTAKKKETIHTSSTKYSVKDRRESSTDYTSMSYSVYDALDEIVEISKTKGADAIINLHISLIYDKNYGKGYEITGMAIKRK